MRIVIAFAALLLASQASAQGTTAPLKEVQAVAQKSLATFSQLVTKDNYRQMGFDDPEEVRAATLGVPTQDFLVRLDMLKKYEPGGSPDALLSPTNQVMFPVLARGQVKSSVTIAKTKEGWQAASFGGPNYVKLVSSTLKESSKVTGLDYASYFVVRVPSLNLFFLGFRSTNELMLVPLVDNARLEFKAGVGMKAEKVFAAIVPEAKAHDGLPR
jgi:hypothetical protein